MIRAVQTILIADDDLDDLQLLEEAILKVEPHTEVHTVSSGKQVLDYLQNCTNKKFPCLIVPFHSGIL